MNTLVTTNRIAHQVARRQTEKSVYSLNDVVALLVEIHSENRTRQCRIDVLEENGQIRFEVQTDPLVVSEQ